MRREIQLAALGLFFSSLVVGQASKAAIIYVSTGNNQLLTIDTTTQTTALIGNTGVQLFDIAFSPSGALFGVTSNSLFSVSSTTGASTLIGSLNVSFVNALGFDQAGVLYGAGGNSLFTIDTSTGLATSIGTGSFSSAGDLDFVGNTLYLSSDSSPNDNLVSLNPANAAATTVGSLGFDEVFGLVNDSSSSTLFGLTSGGQVLSVNTATGAGTSQFSSGINRIFGAAINPVPGPLPVLGVGVAFGWSRKLRRKIKHSRTSAIPSANV